MIELDKRIIKGKRPLDCFDAEQARNFVGKKCYLTNDISLFSDLNAFKDIKGCNEAIYEGVADTLTNINTEVSLVFETTYLRWKFCIPCEWVKESEKKWRPYTGIEFAEKFGICVGYVIRIRDRPENAGQEYEYKIMFVGYRWYKGMFEVFINGCWIDLLTLFELYEYMEDGEWHKFGILEE